MFSRAINWFPTNKPHLVGLLIGLVAVTLLTLYIALRRKK